MADQGPKWIVKDGDGRIYGPFVTQKILRQIEKGYFSGGEMIAKYPGGSWIPITKAPEFYDKLLDVLASEVKPRRKPASGQETGDGSTIPGIDEDRPRGRVVRESEPPVLGEYPGDGSASVSRVEGSAEEEAGPVIELSDLQSLKREEHRKSSKLPMLMIAASVLLVALAFIFQPESKSQQLRLMGPRKGQPQLSAPEIKERFRRGVIAFQGDTLQGYLRAQSEFVQILEGAPKNTEAAAALCMAYREIWPFSAQDSEDMRTFSHVVQDAKRVDPAGFHGATCEILYLMSISRTREARGLTDMWIQMQSSSAILYDVTAELLKGDRKWLETAGYAEKARVLWPKWLKPYVIEARARTQIRQYQQAMQLYRAVLAANQQHHVARIELGLIEIDQFNQADKAYDMIKVALDSGERLPRETEFAASVAMAQILERRSSKNQALAFARRAFALDPNDPTVRNILLRLGGSEALGEGTRGSREIMSRGDELFRLGDYVSAQAEFRASFEADKTNGVAAMKAGKCFWLLNQSEEAIGWLKKAIFADPNLIPAYVLLADYYGQRF
ncbi:MAG: hypothetical protein NDI61_04965, partial [Bdellovibrionaceae bacterium]|nr:hypothetical protein [Pseudobdellovibrionaceae bacterium]